MKRNMRTSLTLLITFCMLFSLITPVFAQFPDIEGHWAEDIIKKAYSEGIALGYPEGDFRPDELVIRAELCAFFNRIMNYKKFAERSFSDVSEKAWYKKAVNVAVYSGYITGYEDGTFRPVENVSRKQTAMIIAKMLKLDLTADISKVDEVADVQELTEDEKGAIGTMLSYGVFELNKDGSFAPNRLMTRAECLFLLRKLKNIVDNPPVPIRAVIYGTGYLDIKLNISVSGLVAEDYIIAATLDNEPYDFENLSFDSEYNRFTFTPIKGKPVAQELFVKVSAVPNSLKLSGSRSTSATIPAVPEVKEEAKPVRERKPKEPVVPEVVISSIASLYNEVYVGDPFALPTTVAAVMSNSETRQVEVSWNPPVAVTSTVGTFTFSGAVSGYSGAVAQTLKVKERSNNLGCIEGVVVIGNPESNEEEYVPAAGVKVYATTVVNDSNMTFEVSTNNDGSFRLCGLPEGDYELIAAKPGYRAFEDYATVKAEETSLIYLFIEPYEEEAILSGKVVVYGQAVPTLMSAVDLYADVTIKAIKTDGGNEVPTNTVTPDSEGNFFFPNLPSGSYKILAEKPDYCAASDSINYNHGEQAALPKNLILYPLGITSSVSGIAEYEDQILDHSGIRVSVLTEDGEEWILTNSIGNYVLPVPCFGENGENTYTFIATANGYESASVIVKVTAPHDTLIPGKMILKKIPVNAPKELIIIASENIKLDSTQLKSILKEYKIGYRQVKPSDIDKENFTANQIVWVLNGQSKGYYNSDEKKFKKLEEFVSSGGTLVFEDLGHDRGREVKLPGGVTSEYDSDKANTIKDTNHPIVSDIDNKLLTDKKENISLNYFSTINGNTTVICKYSSKNQERPTLIEYSLGKGRVIASGMNLEEFSKLKPVLENMVCYVMDIQPQAGFRAMTFFAEAEEDQDLDSVESEKEDDETEPMIEDGNAIVADKDDLVINPDEAGSEDNGDENDDDAGDQGEGSDNTEPINEEGEAPEAEPTE